MQLPEKCSIKEHGQPCQLSPTHVVSVVAEDGEYMMAVVCDEHKDAIGAKIASLQSIGKIPHGRINFESIRTVVTDCVVGMNDDYIDIELDRGIDSDRKLS